jgi:hypothetical protein
VVNVEHRRLRAFEQQRLAVARGLVQKIGRVADVRREQLAPGLAVFDQFPFVNQIAAEHGDQPVGLFGVVRKFLRQRGGIGQVARAQAPARHFVFVGRADAAHGGADGGSAPRCFDRAVERHVVGKNQMRAVADQQVPVRHLDGLRAQPVHLFQQGARGHHHAVADHTGFARVRDAGGNQMQDELLIFPIAADDDGMAGVMAALIPRDNVEVRCDQVNDLAFAFVAPLRTDDCEIHCCVSELVVGSACVTDAVPLGCCDNSATRRWSASASGICSNSSKNCCHTAGS